jgi:hypothetical protein
MKLEKKPFGIIQIFYFLIILTISIFGLLYLSEFFLLYSSLLGLYNKQTNIILLLFTIPFDFFIFYFLFSAYYIIKKRMLNGAITFHSCIVSAWLIYIIRFLSISLLFISFNSFNTYKAFSAYINLLIIFSVFYIFFSLSMHYSRTVKWFFGSNYKGLYSWKKSYYLPFKDYFFNFYKIILISLIFLFFSFLPLYAVIKVFLSILFSGITFYILFTKNKRRSET